MINQFRLVLLVLLCSFLFRAEAWAQDCGSIDPLWVSCTKDDDCVLTTTGTCDPETAINKFKKKAYEAYHSCLAPHTGSCPLRVEEKNRTKPPKASCKNARCRVLGRISSA